MHTLKGVSLDRWVASVVFAAAMASTPVLGYQNPIGVGSHVKDPSVLVTSGTYYVFSSYTADAEVAGNVPLQGSTDLVNWEYLGDALPDLPTWVDPGDAEVRGPATLARPSLGRYLLYFSARHRDDGSPYSGRRCIGVVAADDPTMLLDGSPSLIPTDQPIVCDSAADAFDPFVFTAPNPNGDPYAWLIWVDRRDGQPDRIVHTLLIADGSGLLPGLQPLTLLTAETFFDFWEHGQLANPAMVKDPASGTYYLFYSGNDDVYTVDHPFVDYPPGPKPALYGTNWATCTPSYYGVFSPCERNERRPWVRTQNGAWRPGDADFFRDGNGSLWMMYDASPLLDLYFVFRWPPPTLRLDKVCFSADGKPRTTAPTTNSQSLSRSANCEQDVQLLAEPWPEADQLFHQDPRWRGGDGAWSIDLGGERILWIFGDSFIDPRGVSRIGSQFVRNSIAIQQGADPSTAQMTFSWKTTGSEQTPTAYFPNSGSNQEVWYWASGGAVVGNTLVIFQEGNRVGAVDPNCPPPPTSPTPTPAPTPPPPQAVTIPNYQSAPISWTQNWHNIPKSPVNQLYCSGHAFVSGSYVYVYVPRQLTCGGPLVVSLCRYPVNEVSHGNFSHPRWWTGQAYVQDGAPAVLWNNTAQLTVHQLPDSRYLAVMGAPYPGFGQFATAPTREGPFSSFQWFYDPPETTWYGDGGGVVTYIYQAHPELTGAPAVVTYSTHGSSVFQYDESPYYPKFVRFSPP